MINEYFKVLVVDLESSKSTVEKIDGRNRVAGGSGLAALLYTIYGHPDLDWDHPAQPFILAIGPLTGYYPLMSKTVCSFISPYHNPYT